MESDNSDNIEERDQFANHGGDALNFDADGLQDSEDVDEEEDEDPQEDMRQEQRKAEGSGQKANVKGEKLENQPYDLAVSVNDSEEIESDEEEDEVPNLDSGAPGGQSQQRA